MSRLDDIRAQSTWKDLFEGQPQHLGFAMLLSAGAISLLIVPQDAPHILGLSSVGWAKVSIALAVLHQIIVALVFRLQLHRNVLSRWLGDRDMVIWRMVFIPLLIARPLSLIMAALADTVSISQYPLTEAVIGILFLGLSIWGLHSVLVHFSIRRALGGDHFRDEIAALPLVTKGVFKYTSNGMYGVAFLGLWGIALVFGSWNALVLALFQHCYIWVHMYCTESPDMRWIYGGS